MNFLGSNIVSVFNQNIFVASALFLILGFLFSRLSNWIRLPRVPGYIFAGIIFGPYLLNLINESSVSAFSFFPELALGIIALIIGAGLNLKLIKRLGVGLFWITLLEALGAFILVFVLLLLFNVPLGIVMPLAAIAAATAPAGTIAIIREYRARGPLTETILAVVALDDAIAIILFGLVMTLNPHHLSVFGKTFLISLISSVLEILAAMVVGIILGFVANFIIKISKETSDTLIILLGMVFLGIGLASISHLSPLLISMFIGITLTNIYSKTTESVINLEKLTPPVYCFFFVLAGTHLNFGLFISGGHFLLLWSVIFVISRIFGKIMGAYLGGVVAGVSGAVRNFLGLALIPQAGVAIGLSLLIGGTSAYSEFRTIIINIVLISIAFSDGIIGPICAKYALFKAKEAVVEG